jgi:hypothetical protein
VQKKEKDFKNELFLRTKCAKLISMSKGGQAHDVSDTKTAGVFHAGKEKSQKIDADPGTACRNVFRMVLPPYGTQAAAGKMGSHQEIQKTFGTFSQKKKKTLPSRKATPPVIRDH